MTEEQENSLEDWIAQIEERKKEIADLKVKDRLALVSSITKLHNDIAASLTGWAQWLKNPPIIENLTEEELMETLEVFKRLAIDFMDLDIKMSRAVLARQVKKVKEKIKEKKSNYVA